MLKDSELIGKFIRYSPEISEEVFDKIITRLQKAGFTQTNRSEDRCDWLGTTYKDFQKHQFLWITGIWYDRKNIFSLDNHSSSCTEISYKDIIGEEESLKVEDLAEGEIYVSLFPTQGTYIFKNTIGQKSCSYINISSPDGTMDRFVKNMGDISSDNGYTNYRIATVEEKQWLNLCIQENKFIPKEDVAKYLKSTFTVHNKCNIGDIIVSLEPKSIYVDTRKNGDLLKVLETSTNNSLYYKGYAYIVKENIDTYRLATPQEIELFNKGIKNIYDVKEGEYKVGDWVKLVSIRPQHYNGAGEMDYLLGKVVQLKEPFKEVGINNINFDGVDGWAVSIRDIERKATPEEIYKAGGYPEQKEFVLPEKWFILNIYPEVREYLSKKYNINCINWNYEYIGWDGCSTDKGVHGCCLRSFRNGTVEITFEQFKKYVLKETISASEAKKDNMEEILLEAKRRFPIGCAYKGVMTYGPYIATGKLKSSITTNDIKIFDDGNCIYKNDQWAEVISSPEEKEEKIPWDISWKCATDYWRIPTKEDEELLNSFNKPELLLRDENEPVIFPNIKRERIVEIKIKLVD